MASKSSMFLSLSVATLAVFVAVPGCSKSETLTKGTASASVTSTTETSVADATTSETPVGKASTVVFEVTGTGSALTIDTDPAGAQRLQDVPLPWTETISISPDVGLLQVVVVGKTDPGPGCRITLDGEVVAEEPVGGSAHCIFNRP